MKKKQKKITNFFFNMGVIFFLLGIITFFSYFHIIDNLVNYQDLSLEKGIDKIRMDEYALSGKFIGGYDEQHTNANKVFYASLFLFIISFALMVGEKYWIFMMGGKWNN